MSEEKPAPLAPKGVVVVRMKVAFDPFERLRLLAGGTVSTFTRLDTEHDPGGSACRESNANVLGPRWWPFAAERRAKRLAKQVAEAYPVRLVRHLLSVPPLAEELSEQAMAAYPRDIEREPTPGEPVARARRLGDAFDAPPPVAPSGDPALKADLAKLVSVVEGLAATVEKHAPRETSVKLQMELPSRFKADPETAARHAEHAARSTAPDVPLNATTAEGMLSVAEAIAMPTAELSDRLADPVDDRVAKLAAMATEGPLFLLVVAEVDEVHDGKGGKMPGDFRLHLRRARPGELPRPGSRCEVVYHLAQSAASITTRHDGFNEQLQPTQSKTVATYSDAPPATPRSPR